jgi:hypothetical protein
MSGTSALARRSKKKSGRCATSAGGALAFMLWSQLYHSTGILMIGANVLPGKFPLLPEYMIHLQNPTDTLSDYMYMQTHGEDHTIPLCCKMPSIRKLYTFRIVQPFQLG